MAEQFARPDAASSDSTLASIEAAATRLGRAMLYGIERSPKLLGSKGLELLTLHNLWTTALILVLWLAASVIGGPIGLAVNGILIALALYNVGELAKELGEQLRDGVILAWNAESEHDIEVAGSYFAEAFSTIGIEVLQFFVTHRIFIYAKPRLMKRFRVPSRLEAEHKAAKARAEDRLRNEQRQKVAEEAEQRKSKAEKAKRLIESAAELTAAGGVKPAAGLVPDGEIIVGVVAVAGAVAAVALVASASTRKGRST